MRQWQMDAPRLTASEADQVVDLWLRERLAAVDDAPLDPRALTVPEIAQALGAGEEEVALLLCHIRERKSRRVKPAIPVRKSWFLIAAIYCAFLFFSVGLFSFAYWRGVRSATAYGYPGLRGPRYYSQAMMGAEAIPDEIGFNYRGAYRPESPVRREGVTISDASGTRLLSPGTDWDQVERGLTQAIKRINSEVPKGVGTNVTDAEISAAVSTGKQRALASVSEGDAITPEQIDKDRLISWSVLSVSSGAISVSTYVPATKVADEALDKAVATIVKDRISRLTKALKRLSEGDATPELHSTAYKWLTTTK